MECAVLGGCVVLWWARVRCGAALFFVGGGETGRFIVGATWCLSQPFLGHFCADGARRHGGLVHVGMYGCEEPLGLVDIHTNIHTHMAAHTHSHTHT